MFDEEIYKIALEKTCNLYSSGLSNLECRPFLKVANYILVNFKDYLGSFEVLNPGENQSYLVTLQLNSILLTMSFNDGIIGGNLFYNVCLIVKLPSTTTSTVFRVLLDPLYSLFEYSINLNKLKEARVIIEEMYSELYLLDLIEQ